MYGIVVRNLLIHVADHLCALVHSQAFAVPDIEMFVCKQMGLQAAERTRRVCVRNAVVCRLIQKISKRFEAEGFPWPDPTCEDRLDRCE